jgi:very-short-patch-repair endonuclease
LWSHISARQVRGVRFNRQLPIGPFICDFVSRSARLIIEVDGGQHDADAAADAGRTAYLETHGYRVIRFWNNDVLQNIEGVITEIARVLIDSPSPNPSRKREGDLAMPRLAERYGATPLPSRLREGSGEGLSGK